MKKNRVKVTNKTRVTIDELKSLLLINKDSLDEELVRQPKLFDEAGELYVQAAAERDYAKEALKELDASLYAKHRKNLEKTEERKPSEAMITNAVLLDPAHKKAAHRLIGAIEKADLYGATKDAFFQRAYILRDLAQLDLAHYYDKDSIRHQETAGKNAASRRVREGRAESAKRGRRD